MACRRLISLLLFSGDNRFSSDGLRLARYTPFDESNEGHRSACLVGLVRIDDEFRRQTTPQASASNRDTRRARTL